MKIEPCTTCGTPSENDDIPAGTADRFRSAVVERRHCERFIALQLICWRADLHDDEWYEKPPEDQTAYPVFGPVGGKHPSTFKTLRNARRAAGNDGFVLMFDPRSLPLVTADSTHDIDLGNEIDEESFTERQLLYWERELAAIRARKP